MGLEAWLNRNWYGDGRSTLLLWPLSGLYAAATAVRRWGYRRGLFRSRRPACPVIVVGNLSAGGTGKTPLVIHLVQALQDRGLRAGVASRGYGGAAASSALRVEPGSAAAAAGDEPVLIARRTGAPVFVCRDRAAAAAALAAEGVDLVICDDGLQHLALGRDIEIAVIDGARGLGNGLLIPAGPLREPQARLASVDLVVRNGGEARAGELLMRLVGDEVVNLADGRRRPLAELAGERWHAVAGIGNPDRFFLALEAAGLSLLRHPLPDHARLTSEALEFGDELPVLMTEKDAVKCVEFASGRHWYLPVDARFAQADAERLLETVLARVAPRDQ